MTHNHKPLSSNLRLLMVGLAALALTGCMPEQAEFSGLSPMKRNEVEVVHLTHDIYFSGTEQSLTAEEEARLVDFLENTGVGYGDGLSLDDPDVQNAGARAEALSHILARRGLWLIESDAVIGLPPEANTVRLIVTRSLVRSPRCPDWSQKSGYNWNNARSSNFGCASTTNLGAMIADPSDLVDGKTHAGSNSERAVKAADVYRTRQPAGTTESGGGASGGASTGTSSSGSPPSGNN